MSIPQKYLLLLLCLMPSMIFAQDKLVSASTAPDDAIDWSETKRLSWSDFKSKPDPNSDAAASTTTYLGIEYSFSNNTVSYKIACRFSKLKSWGLHQTDYILSHEQGHFDIAEIFARRLHKKMLEYKFNRKTYQHDLKKIYQEVLDEKEEWQNTYDEETRHSINRKKQAEWLEKIAEGLNEYKAYADYNNNFPSQSTLNASVKIKEKEMKPKTAKRRRLF
jgi:hypothetical protein